MSQPPGTRRGALRILCIEDHPLDRQILARQLGQSRVWDDLTFDVHYATTLGEAVMNARAYEPDICIVDLYLPDSQGIETIHALRRVLPRCAIVVVTADDDTAMLRHAVYANVQGYLVKGEYTATALLRTLLAAWERAQLERQLAEATDQLRQSQAQYRALLEFLPDAVIMTDATGRILYLNAAAQELLGRSSGELIGEELTRWPGSTDHTSDLAIPQRDGRLRYAVMRMQRAIVSGQEVTIYFLHDVTERRRREQEQLERQRTDVLGMLASGIAHDINNLLSPIMLGVQTLLRTASDERTRKVLGMIEQSAKRGAELVRQVLSFARSQDIRREPIRPAEVLQEVASIFRPVLPSTIELVVNQPAPDIPPVIADRAQVVQALSNLVSNAADELHKRGGTITLAAYRAMPEDPRLTTRGLGDGSYVVFEVADTGGGIPEEIRSTLFEPFVTTKPDHPGLGLYTVLTIVKRHRGTIDVESNSAGTRVSLFFPIGQEHPVGQTAVLVASPSATVRNLVAAALEDAGYTVLEAASPAEALATFIGNASRVDIVLADDTDSIPFPLDKLRAMKELKPELGIILLCSLLERQSLAELEEKVVTAFLAKPFSDTMLLETLGRVRRGSLPATA
ncbi:MAG: histidine kinase [Candidatus Kapaibacterium sp.]|nr:MAG: histidine kinase [Candidatus Kapabacteria bacterium]